MVIFTQEQLIQNKHLISSTSKATRCKQLHILQIQFEIIFQIQLGKLSRNQFPDIKRNLIINKQILKIKTRLLIQYVTTSQRLVK